jgi:hypothetical protein
LNAESMAGAERWGTCWVNAGKLISWHLTFDVEGLLRSSSQWWEGTIEKLTVSGE